MIEVSLKMIWKIPYCASQTHTNYTLIDMVDEAERSKSVVSGREGAQKVSHSTGHEMHVMSLQLQLCHFILIKSCRLMTYLRWWFMTLCFVIIKKFDEKKRDEMKKRFVRSWVYRKKSNGIPYKFSFGQ